VELINTEGRGYRMIQAAEILAAQGKLPHAVEERLVQLTATPGHSSLALRASRALSGDRELSTDVIERLVGMTAADDLNAAVRAAGALAAQGELPASVVNPDRAASGVM
jgi:hypothetical protein